MYCIQFKDPLTGATLQVEDVSLDKAIEQIKILRDKLYYDGPFSKDVSLYDKKDIRSNDNKQDDDALEDLEYTYGDSYYSS